MSVFFDLVLNTVCRSNHHRLAIDALAQLKGNHAEQWRDLFLQEHASLLEGAKAPDDSFKDFKNHVLHVRDGYWGGACEAAEEWYRRMVRALSEKNWKYGAYCAGVMSHYIADPIQPFHTGQTEEEGIIHRAVEWSLSKSYMEMRRILLVDLGGWPAVSLEDGPNWLMRAIRAGAEKSNPHYETLITHYNFEVGSKKPELGIDQEIKDSVAGLIGHAVGLLARVFERAFAEAAVAPPSVNLSIPLLLTTLKVPVSMVEKVLADSQDRAIVTAMYKEFRKTGKVRATLPEDDKAVRALYAEEVLNVSLASLDCKWPTETGTAHGQGIPARKTKNLTKPARTQRLTPAEVADMKRAKKVEAKEAARVAATAKADAVLGSKAPVATTPIVAQQATATAAGVLEPVAASVVAVTNSAPVAAADVALESVDAKRIRLRADDAVVDAPSIGRKTADRLHALSVRTVADLLDIDPEDAAQRIKTGHINAKVIRDWQAQARFACSLPDVTSINAQVLTACGILDLAKLGACEPAELLAKIQAFAKSSDGVQLMRGAKGPDAALVESWIKAARGVAKRAAA